ncbi:MAG: trypsin-like peptidase domain-containing protein, partial [Bacteroidota bacterium]
SVVTIQTTEFKVENAQVSPSRGLGSGVLIDPNGLIMTAAHVVESANEIVVKLEDERVFEAEIVKIVPRADVALLKMKDPPQDLAPRVAQIGNTDKLEIGQQILVIGAPFGLEHSLSVGYVSGRMKRNRLLNGEAIGFIQTDAAINQGNSGGPMFNKEGEVIGIVSFILSRGGGFDGIGFGVDINSAKKVLFENNSFWTGFDGVFLDGPLAAVLNIPQASGILVQRVTSNSFADALGLKGGFFQAELLGQKLWLGGDIILSIQGTDCDMPHNLEDIRAQIRNLKEGSEVYMQVLRQGQVIQLKSSL